MFHSHLQGEGMAFLYLLETLTYFLEPVCLTGFRRAGDYILL